MPAIRKKIRNIDKQDADESQRMWQDVTIALKNKDEQTATEAKHAVNN